MNANWSAEGAHTLALTLGNDTNTGTKVTDATATALTVGTTGTTTDFLQIVATKATSLTFNNTAGVDVSSASETMSISASDTVKATGSGALNLGNTTLWTGASQLASINASTATGGVTAEINGAITAFTGGTGNDVITVDTGASMAINGGGGTNTVILTNTAATYNPVLNPTGPISADFTNFQTVELNGAAVTGNYDVSGFVNVLIGTEGAAVVLKNAAQGENLSFVSAPGYGTTYALKTDAGAANALNVTIGVDGTTTAGINVGTLTTATMSSYNAVANSSGIPTVTVNSVGASTMTGSNIIGLADTATGTGTGTSTINVTGDAAVVVADTAAGTNDAITTINVTNTGTTDVHNVVAAAAGVTITGGAGALTASTDTANTATSSIDTVTSGSGGVTLTLGAGGAGGGAATGSENVVLSASSGIRDTIFAPNAPVVGDGTRGIVAGFGVTTSGASSDVLSFFGAGKTVVANDTTVTGTSGSTYSVSNGVFTKLSGNATGATELLDVQQLVGGDKLLGFGGVDNIGAVNIAGSTFVVASNTLTTAGTITPADQTADSIIQLTGVSGISGFGLAAVDSVNQGAGSTVMIGTAITLGNAGNTGSAVAASNNTYVDNGFAIDGMTVASVTGVTNNYTNLGAWAQLNLGGAVAATGGAVTTTQVGASGTNSLVIYGKGAQANVYDSFTANGDANITLDSTTNGFTINSLVDGTNTVATIVATGSNNNITIGGITDTALTTIDGSAMTSGTLTLGSVTALAQNGLTVKVGGGAALVLTASGNNDTITGGNAGDTIIANGATNTITDGSGANSITANGSGDKITVGSLATGATVTNVQAIHASGAGDSISFSSTAADGTAVTYTAVSTVDGGSVNIGIGSNDIVTFGTNGVGGSQTVILTGDVTGATSSGSYAFTTLDNVVPAAGDKITLNNATTEILAGIQSQVNVSGTTSLAKALDLAAATDAMSQQGLGFGQAAGYIGSKTGVVDWFQFAGNTYIVEAVNSGTAAAAHTALGTGDAVIKVTGLVDLTHMTISHGVITL
ncbi:beta strand repeat-containing protein [Ferrovum myxofaciens]|uniref:beta strand repeat-containing protein n=1 Tax=Ferrovum myxofaciens TaxID=416213 RepID=UPI002353FC32|nr:hypothetical protein [Ferrovum myxofaciens]MBU6993429.1 hypothetical protein [Ferrovum myxofaciens]